VFFFLVFYKNKMSSHLNNPQSGAVEGGLSDEELELKLEKDIEFNIFFMQMIKEGDKSNKEFTKLNICYRQHYYPVVIYNNNSEPITVGNSCLIAGPSFKMILPNKMMVREAAQPRYARMVKNNSSDIEKKGEENIIELDYLHHFDKSIPINGLESFLMDRKYIHCNKDTKFVCKRCGVYCCSIECLKNDFGKHKEHCVCYFLYYILILL
jgi:hypothetical protein